MLRYQRITHVDKTRLHDAGLEREVMRITAKCHDYVGSGRSQQESNTTNDRDDRSRRTCGVYTLDQFSAEARQRPPNVPSMSRTTLSNLQQNQLVLLKKMEAAPMDRNASHAKDLRFVFAQWLIQEGIQEQLKFIDEAGLNLEQKNSWPSTTWRESSQICHFTMTFAFNATTGLIHHDLSGKISSF